jgi:hypothetical protein
MAVPDFQTLMLPVLKAFSDGEEHRSPDIRAVVAHALDLSVADQSETVASGQSRFTNRIAWATIYLRRAGLLDEIRRGVSKISERGRELLIAPPERITIAYLMKYPEFAEFRSKRGAAVESEDELGPESDARQSWLLAWNPKNWSWDDLRSNLERSARGEEIAERWSCASSKIEVDDEVWIVRVGFEPRVVFGHGKVVRAPYEAPHWNDARRTAGENADFVDVVFDELRDPDGPEVVSVSKLKEDAKTYQWWTPQQSGIAIKLEAAAALLELWRGMGLIAGSGPDGGVQEAHESYELKDAARDVFMPRDGFAQIVATLRRKRNIVLQGPPGVGKSFVARRIAYSLMGAKAPRRVEMVQFHQAYSYEDFIQGYRPTGNGFELRDGVFCKFAAIAQDDPARTYVFIIDEINRGNLSKVLGELMLLIEADKRGPDWSMPLAYSDRRFHVPANLYLIGLMNTADRSLAMVDYALRRRFAFIDLKPQFDSAAFRDHLLERGAHVGLVEMICTRLTALNLEISDDTANLGPGFCIGHSFFSPTPEEEDIDDHWYRRIIEEEVGPLLHEYWFDDSRRASGWVTRLLA